MNANVLEEEALDVIAGLAGKKPISVIKRKHELSKLKEKQIAATKAARFSVIHTPDVNDDRTQPIDTTPDLTTSRSERALRRKESRPERNARVKLDNDLGTEREFLDYRNMPSY